MSGVGREGAVLRSPGSLAAALPVLVGFEPRESFVVVFLKKGLVALTMRMDLPDGLALVAGDVVETAGRAQADEVILVVCTARGVGDLPHEEGVEAVASACEDGGIGVRDALLVSDGRFWSYRCANPACCPAEGRPVPVDDVLVAEAVGVGLPAPAASRDAFVARYATRTDLAPDDAAQSFARIVARAGLRERCERSWAAVQALAAPGGVDDVADGQLRALVQACAQDVRVRDYVMTQVVLADAGTDALVDVVVRCALTAPDQWRPRVAGAAGALLAACGGNSLAAQAVLAHADGESLADLVATSLGRAVPPVMLREAFAQAYPLVLDQIDADDRATAAEETVGALPRAASA